MKTPASLFALASLVLGPLRGHARWDIDLAPFA